MCACASIKPGVKYIPFPSITRSGAAGFASCAASAFDSSREIASDGTTRTMRLPFTNTSAGPNAGAPDPSITVTSRINIDPYGPACSASSALASCPATRVNLPKTRQSAAQASAAARIAIFVAILFSVEFPDRIGRILYQPTHTRHSPQLITARPNVAHYCKIPVPQSLSSSPHFRWQSGSIFALARGNFWSLRPFDDDDQTLPATLKPGQPSPPSSPPATKPKPSPKRSPRSRNKTIPANFQSSSSTTTAKTKPQNSHKNPHLESDNHTSKSLSLCPTAPTRLDRQALRSKLTAFNTPSNRNRHPPTSGSPTPTSSTLPTPSPASSPAPKKTIST